MGASTQVRDFDEARSILLQTTVTLAVAEQECRFEHRDLHWGNVLISRPEPAATLTAVEREREEGEEGEEEEDTTGGRHMLRGVPVHIHNTGGVRVALIDFTLSRLDTGNDNVAYFNLAEDPGLFEGPQGYCQVYIPSSPLLTHSFHTYTCEVDSRILKREPLARETATKTDETIRFLALQRSMVFVSVATSALSA